MLVCLERRLACEPMPAVEINEGRVVGMIQQFELSLVTTHTPQEMSDADVKTRPGEKLGTPEMIRLLPTLLAAEHACTEAPLSHAAWRDAASRATGQTGRQRRQVLSTGSSSSAFRQRASARRDLVPLCHPGANFKFCADRRQPLASMVERAKRQRQSVNYSQARLEEANSSTPVWLGKTRQQASEAVPDSAAPAKENAIPPDRQDVSAAEQPKGRKAKSMDARALKQSGAQDKQADRSRMSDPTAASKKPGKAGKHAQKSSAPADAPAQLPDADPTPAPAAESAPAAQPPRKAQPGRSRAAASPAAAAAALAAGKAAAAERKPAATAGEGAAAGAAEKAPQAGGAGSKRRSSSDGSRESKRRRGGAQGDTAAATVPEAAQTSALLDPRWMVLRPANVSARQ